MERRLGGKRRQRTWAPRHAGPVEGRPCCRRGWCSRGSRERAVRPPGLHTAHCPAQARNVVDGHGQNSRTGARIRRRGRQHEAGQHQRPAIGRCRAWPHRPGGILPCARRARPIVGVQSGACAAASWLTKWRRRRRAVHHTRSPSSQVTQLHANEITSPEFFAGQDSRPLHFLAACHARRSRAAAFTLLSSCLRGKPRSFVPMAGGLFCTPCETRGIRPRSPRAIAPLARAYSSEAQRPAISTPNAPLAPRLKSA